MNSRDRVINAIKHLEVDRTPYDFWVDSAGLERIFKKIGHRDYEKLLKDLNVDIRHINAVMPADRQYGGYYQNFWGEKYTLHSTKWGSVCKELSGGIRSAETMKELKQFKWPTTDIFDYSHIKALCQKYNGYAIMYGFAEMVNLQGMINGFVNEVPGNLLNYERMHFLGRKLTDFYKDDYLKAQTSAEGKIDIFVIVCDLSKENDSVIPVDAFNTLILPYLKEMVEVIHSLNAYVMLHSRGIVFPFIDRLIEIGVDILSPIQPIGESMRPEVLGRKFGGKICFHGGIDMYNLPGKKGEKEIDEEVKRYKLELGDRGGYICCSSHLLQSDISPKRILALYKAQNRRCGLWRKESYFPSTLVGPN